MFKEETSAAHRWAERIVRAILGRRLLTVLVLIVPIAGTMWSIGPKIYDYAVNFDTMRLKTGQTEIKQALSVTVQASLLQQGVTHVYYKAQEYKIVEFNLCAAEVALTNRYVPLFQQPLKNVHETHKFRYSDLTAISALPGLIPRDLYLTNYGVTTVTPGAYRINLQTKPNAISVESYGREGGSDIPADSPGFFGYSEVEYYAIGTSGAAKLLETISIIARQCGATDMEVRPSPFL